MELIKWLGLQLFADGGEGAEGTGETGVTTPDAGEAKLRALGVPEDGIKRWATRQKNTRSAMQAQTEEQKPTPAATETEPAQKTQEEQTPKYNWEEIKKDPEISKQLSAMMQSRVAAEQAKTKAAEDRLAQLTPALEDLSVALGLDPKNLDIEAIIKAANEKGQMFYADKAFELGTNNDTARKIVKAELQHERDEALRKQNEDAAEKQRQDEAFRQHIQGLMQQGEELKKTFPAFDLQAEMQNPKFRELTRPGAFSVEDAYRFLHRAEIESKAAEVIAQQQAIKLANSIRAGQQRPTENGTAAQAPTVTTFNYAQATPEQKKQYREFLARETAAGRKVIPGVYRPPR